MRAIDTNVLVRLLVRDDAAQTRSAEAYIEQGAWVSHLVLAETLWVLDAVYQRSPAQLATAVELLLDHVQITVQDADVVAHALKTLRGHSKVAFSDCLVLAIARKAGHMPLGTFDRHLARVPGAEHVA